jgi:2-octaprenyl-6-methoxyphenol hydroxylase
MSDRQSYDVAIVGGGPAGLIAAILVARTGANTISLAPRPSGIDRRTSALMRGSLDIMDDAGILSGLIGKSAPLRTIRIIDDSGHLFRGPPVEFDCDEVGGEPFARNFHNSDLVAALLSEAETQKNLTLLDEAAATIDPCEDLVRIDTASGQKLAAELVIGADGRMSPCRNAARISSKTSKLPQSALVFNVDHAQPHDYISTEFHRSAGPLTLVPLPGNMSSVVWVETHENAHDYNALDDDIFLELFNEKTYGIMGNIRELSPRAMFPLSNLTVEDVGRGLIALIGEAAHVVPPIGAQGLNLGFRDAATIARLIGSGSDKTKGARAIVHDYAQGRKRDISTRSGLVNLLNRSLLSNFLPVQMLRSSGLAALANITPLRKVAMHAGIGPRV